MASESEKRADADTVEHVDASRRDSGFSAKRAEVQSVALADALARDGPKYTDKSHLMLYGIMLFATLSMKLGTVLVRAWR